MDTAFWSGLQVDGVSFPRKILKQRHHERRVQYNQPGEKSLKKVEGFFLPQEEEELKTYAVALRFRVF